jgi:transcriptional/translational regulatory protein YebC/TACO1
MPPKTRSRKPAGKSKPLKTLAIAVAAVIVVAFLSLLVMHFVFRPKPQRKVLQLALADQFGSDAGAIIPNVPARNGRYPGAVLAVSGKGSELLVRRMDRPESPPATSGSLKGAQLSEGSAAWQLTGRMFGGKAEGSGSAAIEIDLEDIRIFEHEASKLAADLRNDESVNRARASGQQVAVVTKAYEAIPIITVRQRSDAKSEDWAKLKGALTKAKGELLADNSVRFRSAEPQVVAYETSDAKFIATNFSGGEAKLELKPRRPAAQTLAAPRPEDFGAQAAGEEVAFSVIASPVYANKDFGDLPAATASAALVDELFAAADAKRIETGLDPSARLTSDIFAATRARLAAAVKEKKPRAFVLYYAGHAVSGTAGAQYLVMGDYQGNLAEDLKQTSPLTATRNPALPSAGSNINDVARALNAAAQELPATKPGMVPIAELYREFAETGVPFAILVDGCYEAEAISTVREELKLTPWGDYFGADDGGPGQVRQYQEALRAYGEAPYLRSANPVIFSARPGTIATVVKHPFFDGDLVPGVAPLAAKLGGTYLYALENRDELPLGVWLRRITDFAGTGELDVKGSISWSTFDALRPIQMVSFGATEASPK